MSSNKKGDKFVGREVVSSNSTRKRANTITLDWCKMILEDQKAAHEGHVANLRVNVKSFRELVEFPTLTTYTGGWDLLGMRGNGKFCFPNGCEYEGQFEDGMLHGEGSLTYPMGQKLETIFEKGKMVAYKFCNIDGLDYGDSWEYCRMPDRRFNVSIREGLQPAGREFMTNQQPQRVLDLGCYDTCDGVYNPEKRCILSLRDPNDYSRWNDDDVVEVHDDDLWIRGLTMVSKEKHEWIIHNCRNGTDEPAGYRPEFYEDWISGRRDELEELDKKYVKEESPVGSTDSEQVVSRDLIVSDSDLKGDTYAGTGRILSPINSSERCP